MKNRMMALLAILILFSSAIWSNGGKEAVASTEEASDHPFGPKMTITFTGIYDVPPSDDGTILNLFEERYNVDYQYINVERSKYSEMLALKITTGDIPDVFTLDGNMLQYSKFVNQGALANIDIDLMKSIAPSVYKNQQAKIPYLKVDGGVYAICGEKGSLKWPLNSIWRKDWLEAVGINKTPQTLAEAEKALYAFTQKDPDGNGKNDTYGLGLSGLDAVFGAFGGIPWGPWPQYWLWLEDGKGGLQNAAVLPGMKDALALLQKWYADGVLDPEYVLGENKGGYWGNPTDFFNNKIGFTGLGHYYHWAPPLFEGDAGGRVYKEFATVNPEAEVAYGKAIIGPKGDQGTWLYPMDVGAAGMTVFGSTIEKGKMERFLAIMEDQADYDTYLQFRFGNEGTHWIKDPVSGSVVSTEAFNSREALLREGIQMTAVFQTMENENRTNPLLTKWADEFL
jgi:putative aldouronate transport system substrate-binding protein